MPGGSFSVALDAALALRHAPARCWAHLGTARQESAAREPFCWTGANSERSRRRAGYALVAELDALHDDPAVERIHIVAHSHGGNALLYALASTMSPWPKLGELVFLGTPFLRPADASSRPRLLWGLLVTLAMAAVLALWSWPRSEEFWRFWLLGVFGFALVAGGGYLAKFASYQRQRGGRLGEGRGSVTAQVFAFRCDEALRALRASVEVRDDPIAFVDAWAEQSAAEQALAARIDPTRRDLDMPFRPAAMFIRWQSSRVRAPELHPMVAPRPKAEAKASPPRIYVPPPVDPTLGKTSIDFVKAATSGLPPSPITDAGQREVVRDALLLLAATLLPLTELGDRIDELKAWAVSKLRTRIIRSGLKAAAKNALGDDLAGGAAREVASVPFGVRHRLYVIPEELERRVDERSRAAAGHSALAAWSGLGAGKVTALARYLRTVFTADDLAHCRYYQEPEVIDQVAQVIAEGRCSWAVRGAETRLPDAPAPGPGGNSSG